MRNDADLPVVDLTDAMRAIEGWRQAELGWHALRQFNDPRIEPPPGWERKLDRLRPILKRGFDPVRRQHYWEAIAEFDERLVEAVWSARIAISLDNPVVPILRPAFRYAWLGVIDIIEQRRKGDWSRW